MTTKKIYTYRFISNYAVITFTVPGEAGWNEDEWDTAATDDLASYVTNPEDYYMDDCWEDKNE